MYENNELYHYGVKGMKWGVSKEIIKGVTRQVPKLAKESAKKPLLKAGKTVATKALPAKRKLSKRDIKRRNRYEKKISKKVGELNSKYDMSDAVRDYKSLGKRGVKRINKRLNKGQSYVKAYSLEVGRQATTDMAKKLGGKVAKTLVTTALIKVGTDYVKYCMNQRMGVKLLNDPNIIDLGPDSFKILN